MKSKILLSAVLLLAASSQLHAQADLKVPQQYPTIQEAVDHALASDFVTVSKGTYAPFFLVHKTDLTIRTKGKVVIDATGISFGIHIRYPAAEAHGNLIQQNTVRGAGAGIKQYEGSTCSILDNLIKGDIGTGIAVGPAVEGIVVSHNRIHKPTMTGISVSCTAGDFRNNTIKKPITGICVYAAGRDCDFQKNEIDWPKLFGLVVAGTNHTFDRNRVEKAGAHGFSVDGEDSKFTRNNVKGSRECGFRIHRKNNLFRKNVAKKSGEYDLRDSTAPGDNTYINNKFGTIL